MSKNELYGDELLVSILHACHTHYKTEVVTFSERELSAHLFEFKKDAAYKKLFVHYIYDWDNEYPHCPAVIESLQTLRTFALLTWWSFTEKYTITKSLLHRYETYIDKKLDEKEKEQIQTIAKSFTERFTCTPV